MSDIQTKRHDLAHILATAVLDMFPEAKLGTGPDTDNGFYYDFDLPRTLQPEDLPILEKKMKKILSQGLPFEHYTLPVDEAMEFLKKTGQDYKVELVAKFKEQKGVTEVSFYKNGDFVDLCEGPHNEHTGQATKHFQLTSIAGAYWQADATRPMMQRIYGVAFNTKEELQAYKDMMAEAKKRDHRVLGKKLGLFTIDPEVGPGLPLWKPKGAMILSQLRRWYEDEQMKRDYAPVYTPHIGRKTLWETSGHWGFYNESMYPPMQLGQTLADYQDNREAKEDETYLLKPMNCPFHMKVFNADMHSYRDLPQKLYEFGTVYRYEQKGELGGLTRVRGFTQDDAHIICRKDQLKKEFGDVVDFAFFVLKETFGFDIELKVSLRDPESDKYLGSDDQWNAAEDTIREILDEKNIDYESEIGEAAFYGPKADFKVKDAIGRQWQLSTVQFDFNLPERFKMHFINEEGKEEEPFVIHRALFGSLERFMGILIEHYAGAFPAWLAPVQVSMLPVAAAHQAYADEVYANLKKQGVRLEMQDSTNSLGKRIRNAEQMRIPYMLVIGDNEVEKKTVTVRSYEDKSQTEMSIEEFENFLQKQIG